MPNVFWERAGELWEHSGGSIVLLVLERVSNRDSWQALTVVDVGMPDREGVVHNYAEEFFTEQEWWRRIA